MQKFQKKPVQVKARLVFREEMVDTLEGTVKANIGDYIITGVDGEKYPVTSKTFHKVYDILDMKEGIYTCQKKPIIVSAYRTSTALRIHTIHGILQASAGDYIITGVDGREYPCKADIFEKTYTAI